jgi:uncharacterized phage infection (PIP) family protein YhgE
MATPQEIQRLLDEIQRTYDRLGATNPFANYDTSNITDAVTEAQRLQTALRGVQQALRDASTGAEEIRDAFSRAVDEIKNQSSAIGQSTKALRGLQSIAQKLSYDQAGITKLSKKELENLQEQAKQRKTDLASSVASLRLEKSRLETTQGTTEEIQKVAKALEIAEIESAQGASNYEALNNAITFRIKQEEKINELLGLGGAAINGIGDSLKKLGLGGLADRVGLKEAQEEMRKVAEEMDDTTSKFDGQLKVLNAGIGVIGKNLAKNLIEIGRAHV